MFQSATFFFFCFIVIAQSLSFSLPISFKNAFIEKLSEESEAENGTIWAVLVAGSSGFNDYRHQADVGHAWHTLVNHGVNPENIVTMMYDDIANNVDNPHPGKIFNSPNGKDVYAGVRIDYRRGDVSPENFMAILLGNEKVVGGKRLLKSTRADKVFIYFTDHGANGFILFPTEIMSVKNLTETLKEMHKRNLYKELTFYLEACESGSILCRHASNDREPSYGCYCETQLVPNTCLGDLFSVNWMEDADLKNLKNETLAEQFEIVKEKTNKSHVQKFGNMKIAKEYLAEFMGHKAVNESMGQRGMYSPWDFPMYSARDIPLLQLASKNDVESQNKLQIFQKKRKYFEEEMSNLVRKVLPDPLLQRHALSIYPPKITQLECHHKIVNTFHRFCFNFVKNPYALKFGYVLTNLCELEIRPERIEAIMMEHCAGIRQINGGIV